LLLDDFLLGLVLGVTVQIMLKTTTPTKLSFLSAELLAMDKSIDHVNSVGMPQVVILMESKYSAITIPKASHDNYITSNKQKKTGSNSKLIALEIHHIPSHTGIPQNELVTAKNDPLHGTFTVLGWCNSRRTDWRKNYDKFVSEKRRVYCDLSDNNEKGMV